MLQTIKIRRNIVEKKLPVEHTRNTCKNDNFGVVVSNALLQFSAINSNVFDLGLVNNFFLTISKKAFILGYISNARLVAGGFSSQLNLKKSD